MLLSGYFFYMILVNVIEFTMQQVFQAQQFGTATPPFDASAAVMRGFFSVLSTLLLFLVPVMTMGVLAEEKKGNYTLDSTYVPIPELSW